ncbi:ankyrin repeat and SAM domain-containing protein 4B isoform X1 [Ictalurus punctatus]|uniref:Ankyrin repeat and SAM domain-containing protein 4B isoform X1 n=2 Tax=Ictalurus punctatus TaxID=7998 RepID=A0A2D0SC47_ICTPU|nr:ankyrin repeat and SAM domain-containing protein 4B isoform X1 [Ictalurus punctatus]
MSRYHKAAIDGNLHLLKEATRKDLNTEDEDGMTPTLWAAYHGQLEALQLICSRGGDPNKSDIWGNTPLHHAASKGHMHILSFLVTFGANVFALDNDLHSPMDIAASRDQMSCVHFLDNTASQKTMQNPKTVANLRKQAVKDAERKMKKCEMVKKRHQNKMDKMYRSSGGSVSEASAGSFSSTGSMKNLNKLTASSKFGSITGTLQRKFGKKDTVSKNTENGTAEKPELLDVFNEQDEKEEDEDEIDNFQDEEEDDVDQTKESLFQRPGLGKMVFRKNFSMEMGVEPEEIPIGDTEDLGFLVRQEVFEAEEAGLDDQLEEDSQLPWNQEEIGLDEDEETSPLHSFLTSVNLLDFALVFIREKLDLKALMLCSDDDLKSIRIQLGPRKKILEATARRKAALDQPGVMKDTFL